MSYWVRALQHASVTVLRYAAVLVLCLAIVAPKVSLALASVVGDGYQSVIICSGGALVRLTLSPNGEIVEDLSAEVANKESVAWGGQHCTNIADHTERLHRCWQSVCFGPSSSVPPFYATVDHSVGMPELIPISNRGPPLTLAV